MLIVSIIHHHNKISYRVPALATTFLDFHPRPTTRWPRAERCGRPVPAPEGRPDQRALPQAPRRDEDRGEVLVNERHHQGGAGKWGFPTPRVAAAMRSWIFATLQIEQGRNASNCLRTRRPYLAASRLTTTSGADGGIRL